MSVSEQFNLSYMYTFWGWRQFLLPVTYILVGHKALIPSYPMGGQQVLNSPNIIFTICVAFSPLVLKVALAQLPLSSLPFWPLHSDPLAAQLTGVGCLIQVFSHKSLHFMRTTLSGLLLCLPFGIYSVLFLFLFWFFWLFTCSTFLRVSLARSSFA